MPKFSKGYWTLKQSTDGQPYVFAGGDDRLRVCVPSWSPLSREECEANVALIEDAPRLYDLLAQIVKEQEKTGKISKESLVAASLLVEKHD